MVEKENLSSVDQVFDEHREKLKKKKFNKSKNKIFIFACCCGFILSLTFYLLTDYSKITGLEINGNYFLEQKQIQELSGLTTNSRNLFVLSFVIENKLEKHDLIESCTVNKNNDGMVVINIKEKELIGYRYLDKPEIITKKGELITMSDEYAFLLPKIPIITGFVGTNDDGSLLEQFANAFSNVEQSSIVQIAEIHQVAYTYDTNGILCLMQDGNRIFGSFYSMEMLNSYNEVASALPNKRACIYIDEMSGNPYTSLCPEELQALEEAENTEENEENSDKKE